MPDTTAPATSAAAAVAPSSALKRESALSTSTTSAPAINTTNASGASAPQPGQPKRRARRVATAERRASHNAVERMRRESLNGRFMTLASMLPPLATIRRPSKSAIVHSSIATVNASRRHRVLAAQTLRSLTGEAETLHREINEWRARARVPPLATPVRPDAHEVVLRAETEDFDLLEEVLELEEDEDEVREEDVTNTRNGNGSPVSPQTQETAIDRSRPRSVSISTAPDFARGSEAASFAPPFTPVYQAQFSAPLPFGESPSSPASSASGGWDGPATPPASAGPMHGMVLSQPLAHAQRLAPLQTGGPPKGYEPYFDAMPGSAGAAYDLGPAFDGAESVFLGGGAGMGTRAGGDTGMGWVERNASHPAFHYQQAAHNAIPPRDHQHMRVARAERDAANRMEMGGARMGMQMGVAAGRYLHQGARFA